MKNNINPLVSVIIPVFNGALYLEEAVRSVQASTYRDFEIILIDDGSSDHSKKICQQLEQEYPNVTFYSFAKNRGLGRVLNFALEKAQGTYICRLNQDDRMLPHRIQTQVAFLQEHLDVVAVGSWIRLFNKTKSAAIVKFLPNDAQIKKVWLLVSPFADPSVMYRKEIALKAGAYQQEFWPADDTHLWYRMGTLGKLANIQEPLAEVRWHNKAASIKYFRQLTVSLFRVHRFAHEYINKGSLLIQLYWILQFVAGMTLSPGFNWGVYRLLKKWINNSQAAKERFLATTIKRVARLIPHPKKLKISGVYSK